MNRRASVTFVSPSSNLFMMAAPAEASRQAEVSGAGDPPLQGVSESPTPPGTCEVLWVGLRHKDWFSGLQVDEGPTTHSPSAPSITSVSVCTCVSTCCVYVKVCVHGRRTRVLECGQPITASGALPSLSPSLGHLVLHSPLERRFLRDSSVQDAI